MEYILVGATNSIWRTVEEEQTWSRVVLARNGLVVGTVAWLIMGASTGFCSVELKETTVSDGFRGKALATKDST